MDDEWSEEYLAPANEAPELNREEEAVLATRPLSCRLDSEIRNLRRRATDT